MFFFSYIKNIFKRILLFQFLFIFSIIKLRDTNRFKFEFSQRIKILLEIFYLDYNNFYSISLEEQYKFYFCLLIFISFLAIIFNVKIILFITGLLTILSAFLFYGPINLMKKYFEYGKFSFLSIKIYDKKMPCLEFLLLISCGFGIILNTFLYEEKKEETFNENNINNKNN